ncbi:MAG: DNA methylase [Bacteroidetes bacterium HGW-Bacteroidetes-13]|nr:MAG: DNA methylase [Bacteroidetes bacterium HGW-Bacteroidetes-13]
MANRIIPYRKDLKLLAQELRKNQTPAEQSLWERIRKKQLGAEFHRQVPILDYIVDFYCHEIGLAIEVDGLIHETQFLEDAKRQGKMEEQGVKFLRYTNQEIYEDLESILEGIKEVVRASA